nr:MAG TPA: hypothetical protein [Caudoviricetes sp.]
MAGLQSQGQNTYQEILSFLAYNPCCNIQNLTFSLTKRKPRFYVATTYSFL